MACAASCHERHFHGIAACMRGLSRRMVVQHAAEEGFCGGAARRVLQTAISEQAVANYVFDAQAIPFLTAATQPPASSGLTFIQARLLAEDAWMHSRSSAADLCAHLLVGGTVTRACLPR